MSETINERIKRLRKNLGYTQADVAKELNLKLSTYSQMERKGNINSDTIIKLSEILKVDEAVLIYGKSKKLNQNIEQLIKNVEDRIDIPEIPFLVTKNLYEKLIILAMRNLSEKDNRAIYEYILEKLKAI